MLGFLKKIFGLPTKEEEAAAAARAPYKVETPAVNNKTGEVVEPVVVPVTVAEVVNTQITDSVTQTAPVKKTRKPRTPKAEKTAKEKAVKEKAAKPVKAAAKRTGTRSKKA